MRSLDLPLPPMEFRNHDDEAYFTSGQHAIRQIAHLVHIEPSWHVLDIGCAAGRLACPFIGVLEAAAGGGYVGVDVKADRIAWATEHLTAAYPNFRFAHMDVKSRYMNPTGGLDPSTARLPVEARWANLVILYSVFTHMVAAATRQYFAEIVRCLAPGGYAYATFFLYDAAARRAGEASAWKFPYARDGVRLHDIERPEYAVAVEDEFLQSLLREHRLTTVHRHVGKWREGIKHGQDFLLLRGPG